MKFEMLVTHTGDTESDTSKPWVESYDKPELKTESAVRDWAHRTIEYFNSTLREFEKPRALLEVTISEEPSAVHMWEKTNLVTIQDRGQMYDTAKCRSCGITARRYGLENSFVRDKKFSAKGFDSCAQSAVLLARRRNKQSRRKPR